MKHSIQTGMAALAVFLTVGLSACTTTISRNVDDAGKAEALVFPKIDENTWNREGTAPSLDRLHQVRVGMTKDQLMDTLGHPHFAEGLWNVREWDYLFKLHAADGSTKLCQFKVLFDRNMIARGLHALPLDCAS